MPPPEPVWDWCCPLPSNQEQGCPAGLPEPAVSTCLRRPATRRSIPSASPDINASDHVDRRQTRVHPHHPVQMVASSPHLTEGMTRRGEGPRPQFEICALVSKD